MVIKLTIVNDRLTGCRHKLCIQLLNAIYAASDCP